MDEGDGNSTPRSIDTQRPVERLPARGKITCHLNSWQTEECINPVRGLRDWQRRNGINPHDHHRDNLIAVHAKSKANSMRRKKESQEAANALPPFTPHLSSRRPSSPRARSRNTDSTRDYIYQNAVATKLASTTARSRRYATDEGEEGKRWLQKQGFGQIPVYLQTWKAMLAEQHAMEQSQRLEKLVPKGMRIMPEDERLKMLELLEKGGKDIEWRIQSQPLIIETPSQKQMATHLVQRLGEIKEAIRLFSRKTVLVEE